MSAKKDMLAKINKKTAHYKELKKKTSTVETAQHYIFDYFRQVEDLYNLENSATTTELHNQLSALLCSKLRLIDPKATIGFIVPDGIHVVSVNIQWSTGYLLAHPDESAELVVGVADMLFI